LIAPVQSVVDYTQLLPVPSQMSTHWQAEKTPIQKAPLQPVGIGWGETDARALLQNAPFCRDEVARNIRSPQFKIAALKPALVRVDARAHLPNVPIHGRDEAAIRFTLISNITTAKGMYTKVIVERGCY